ncbi:MAG: heme NO-binding domain-containing protein [Treponema sp.]|jgi:hypothetical protein|nr:heme NO-binding domain-containing protein [Treponema sp.]
MRSQIFLCLTELIKEKFGKEKLDRILAESGLSDGKAYMRYFNTPIEIRKISEEEVNIRMGSPASR